MNLLLLAGKSARWFSCVIVLLLASQSYAQDKQFLLQADKKMPQATTNITERLTIVRGIGNYPPLEMIRNSRLTGLHIDMIEYAAEKLGIEVEFISIPWPRAIKEFSTGKVDAIVYFGYTEERAEFSYYHAANILSDTKWVFLALEERADEFKFDHSLSGLENVVIGVQMGYSHGKYFDSMKHLQRDVVLHDDDIEEMLRTRRHDLAMVSYQEFLGAKEQGDFKGIVALSPAVDSDPQYIAFAKVDDENERLKKISELFAKELHLFKNHSDYEALLKSYDFYHYQ
ncbi:MAG: polar amino acid transport system substrate-binding protein [Oleispira sp.]|jgi:polar amino acid transport system substrate-binding protein